MKYKKYKKYITASVLLVALGLLTSNTVIIALASGAICFGLTLPALIQNKA